MTTCRWYWTEADSDQACRAAVFPSCAYGKTRGTWRRGADDDGTLQRAADRITVTGRSAPI